MFTIMCIDDHIEDLVDSLTALYKELKVNILIAHTYNEALNYLKDNQIDIFIIDIELSSGRYTGIHLADIIRNTPTHSSTPIIFISMYSHYSRRLLSTIQNCIFLSKPVQFNELLYTVGSYLKIPKYTDRTQNALPFIIPISQNRFIEIDPKNVSFIELDHNELIIQYINGEKTTIKCMHGCFKMIVEHVNSHSISYLKQIYRSIIVNIDQIKKIDIQGNIGTLWLFGDPTPKPIGSKFKCELSELL